MKRENVFYASHDKKRQFTRSGDMMKNIEKRNLLKLASDFMLLDRKQTYKRVKNIIETGKTYEDARCKIMSLYDETYM